MDKIHWSFSCCLRLNKDGVRLFYFDRKKAGAILKYLSPERTETFCSKTYICDDKLITSKIKYF